MFKKHQSERASDSLANDGCLATLCDRYDLTIAAIEPPVLEMLRTIVPFLRGHALWMLRERGVGKTHPHMIFHGCLRQNCG